MPRLQIRHGNTDGLLAVGNALDEAQVTADDRISASLRMRPDLHHTRLPQELGSVRLPACGQHRSSRTDPRFPPTDRALLPLGPAARLAVEQPAIPPFYISHQIVVPAILDDVPISEHEDPVEVANGR